MRVLPQDSARVASGRLSIAQIEPVSAHEWDATWEACEYGTYFHSRDWSELWADQQPGSSSSAGQVVVFSDGMRAVLPLLRRLRGNGLLESYSASADGMFGGWLSRDPLRAEHAGLLTDHLLWGMNANLSWRINPYDPHQAVLLRAAEGQCVWIDWGDARRDKALQAIVHLRSPLAFPDQTHVLDLARGYDALFRPKSGVVRDAKKAEREGISIQEAATLDQWREYYRVYLDSIDRWGSDPSSAYPLALFEEMFALRSPSIKLWIAKHRGTIVSGALCLYAKQHVVYWHGAALRHFLRMGPVNLLMLEIIRDACEHGYRWYDFNPSGYGPGVTAFKKKFRPLELECPLIYVDRPVKRVGRTLLLGMGRA